MGQSLLEGAATGTGSRNKTELYGFVRGVGYAGFTPPPRKPEFKSLYGEASLKVASRFGTFGSGFTEFRLRQGVEFDNNVKDLLLREAYIDLYFGKLSLSFGQKIIVWGKADGINPTNNLTPMNLMMRSPDPDDRRMGNILVSGSYRIFSNLSVGAIWIPAYKASVLPWQFATFPEGVAFTEGPYPDLKFKNGSVAARLELNLPSFEGSLSWYSGYSLNPGIALDTPGTNQSSLIQVRTRAFRHHVAGFDFSTAFGSFGFRGEAALRIPENGYEKRIEVPAPDAWYVLGIDRSFGNVHLIAQYAGRHVFGFEEIRPPADSLDMIRFGLEQGNRLFQNQQVAWSHSVSLRISVNLFYESMTAGLFTMGNFSTGEYVVIPKLTYRIADGLQCSLGCEWYSGAGQTLYNMIEDPFNSVFIELKALF